MPGAPATPPPGSPAPTLDFVSFLHFSFPFRAHTGVTSWLAALCTQPSWWLRAQRTEMDTHPSPTTHAHTHTDGAAPTSEHTRKASVPGGGNERTCAVTPGSGLCLLSSPSSFSKRKWRTQSGGPCSRGCLSWAAPCLYVCVHMHIDPRVYINRRPSAHPCPPAPPPPPPPALGAPGRRRGCE